MQITVSEPEKRTGSSSVKQDTYVVYLIECKYAHALSSPPNSLKLSASCVDIDGISRHRLAYNALCPV